MSLPPASLAEVRQRRARPVAQQRRPRLAPHHPRRAQRRDQADAHTRTSAAVAVREQRYDGAEVLGYARQLLGRYARIPVVGCG